MRISSRLTQLERSAKARAGCETEVSSRERLDAMAYVMSEDAVGRSIWTRLRALTPQAQADPNFDYMAAAKARPEVAEAVIALSNRWREVLGYDPRGE